MARRNDDMEAADLHNARGIELADRGWFDEAAKEFQKAIALDPNAAHPYDNLGTVQVEQGQLVSALKTFLQGAEAEPDNPSAYHYLATFLAAHGLETALQLYRQALELDPDYPEAHLNYGMALLESGDEQTGLQEILLAHTQAPEDIGIAYELATCLMELDKYPEAITHLKRLLKMDPNHIEAWVDLGISYTAQGFFAEAEAALQKAIALDDTEVTAHYHLAVLYVVWQKKESALKHLDAAVAQDHEKVREWLQEDQSFAPLHEDNHFQALLAGNRPQRAPEETT